jgi:hypothetical protein
MCKGSLFVLLGVLAIFVVGCGLTRSQPGPSETLAPSLTTIADIERAPEAFRDQAVRIQGYGIIEATVPLCPGYVGMDRRTQFVDAAQKMIAAQLQDEALKGQRRYDPQNLRVFEGYIRIFSGEIGCPGATQVETFPYFEITGVQ